MKWYQVALPLAVLGMLSSGCSFLVMERQSFNRDQVVNAQSEDKVCEVNSFPIVTDSVIAAYALVGAGILVSLNQEEKIAPALGAAVVGTAFGASAGFGQRAAQDCLDARMSWRIVQILDQSRSSDK